MNTAIEKTEALIHSRRVLDAMYDEDPYQTSLSFHAAIWMDERY